MTRAFVDPGSGARTGDRTTGVTLRLIQLGLGGWGRDWVREVTRAVPGAEAVARVVDTDAAARERARPSRKAPGAACITAGTAMHPPKGKVHP